MSSAQDNKLMQNEERIDRYLRGEMATWEREAFERDLQTNSRLRRQAVAMAIMIKSMANVGNMEDEKLVSNIFDTYDTVFEEAYASSYEEILYEPEEKEPEEKEPTSGLRASAKKERHQTENEENAKSSEKQQTPYCSDITESRNQIRCSSITEAPTDSVPETSPANHADADAEKSYRDTIASMSEGGMKRVIGVLKYITEQLKKRSQEKKKDEGSDEC